MSFFSSLPRSSLSLHGDDSQHPSVFCTQVIGSAGRCSKTIGTTLHCIVHTMSGEEHIPISWQCCVVFSMDETIEKQNLLHDPELLFHAELQLFKVIGAQLRDVDVGWNDKLPIGIVI